MKQNFILIVLSLLSGCFSLFMLVGIFHELIFVYILLITFLLILFGLKQGKFSPSFLFVLSIFIFIWSRPFLSLFSDIELVEAGNFVHEDNLINTIAYIGLLVSLIILSYYISLDFVKKICFFYENNNGYKIIYLNQYFKYLFYISILLGIFFLYFSYEKMVLLGTSSYFQVTSENSFYTHLFYFFLAKQFMIIYLLLDSNQNKNFILISFLLFIFSIGFILIGLRGYTIAYMFSFLFFINLKYKINFLFLFFIGIILIYVAAIVIEFRLGFKIYDNFWDIIKMTFFSQGASFEVVYGSVTYQEELKECISYTDYFQGKSFGDCVDQVRGVNFAEGGGFASAFFAEILYFTYFGVLIFSFSIGFIIALLDQLFIKLKRTNNNQKVYYIYLLFFLILPNLVYLGRSSAFDLISKFIISSIIVLIVINLGKIYKKIIEGRL